LANNWLNVSADIPARQIDVLFADDSNLLLQKMMLEFIAQLTIVLAGLVHELQ
jgi:hypothetical protein